MDPSRSELVDPTRGSSWWLMLRGMYLTILLGQCKAWLVVLRWREFELGAVPKHRFLVVLPLTFIFFCLTYFEVRQFVFILYTSYFGFF